MNEFAVHMQTLEDLMNRMLQDSEKFETSNPKLSWALMMVQSKLSNAVSEIFETFENDTEDESFNLCRSQ